MTAELLDRPKVLRTAHQFLAIAEKQEAESVAAQGQSKLEVYRKSEFQILVVGEVKRGKSTFINALLGETDLLPIDTQVATSTVYKVMYGDTKKYKIFFNPTIDPEKADSKDGSQYKDPQEPIETTDPEVMAEYGTEPQNPNNDKEVERIEVYLPNPFLESGVVIIDTPGLNSLFGGHAEIPWRYAPTASAICFVLDSDISPATDEDMANLRKFLEIAKQASGATPSLFFVQTKVDAVDNEKWQTYRDDNIGKIQDNLQEYFTPPEIEHRYFPISSRRKVLADAAPEEDVPDSGFSPMLEFLEDTLKALREQSARELLEPIQQITTQNLHPHIVNKEDLLRKTNEARKKGHKVETQEIMSHLNKWEKQIFPEVKKRFAHKEGNIRIRAESALQKRLDPRGSNPIIEPLITELKEEAKQISAEHVNDASDAILTACTVSCNAVIVDVLGSYQDDINALIRESLKELLESLDYEGTLSSVRGITSTHKLDMSNYSRFDEIRHGLYGAALPMIVMNLFATVAGVAGVAATGVAATGVAATGVAATGVAATGVAATGVAATGAAGLGVVVGGVLIIAAVAVCIYILYRHAKKTGTLNTISKLQEVMVNVVADARHEATEQFKLIAHTYVQEVSDQFERAAKEVGKEAKRNLSMINEASDLDTETYNQKVSDLKEQKKSIEGLLDALERMLGSGSQAASTPSQ